MLKLLGLVGGFFFAACGVPAAFATVRAGRSVGTPISVASMILAGAICMYLYLLLTYGFDWVLAINYAVETASWGTIVAYHYFPRKWAGTTETAGAVPIVPEQFDRFNRPNHQCDDPRCDGYYGKESPNAKTRTDY